MTDWDWADHKAVGVLSVVTGHGELQPVKEAWFWYAQHRHEQDAAGHTAVAEALREAYEAGREDQRRDDANEWKRTLQIFAELGVGATIPFSKALELAAMRKNRDA